MTYKQSFQRILITYGSAASMKADVCLFSLSLFLFFFSLSFFFFFFIRCFALALEQHVCSQAYTSAVFTRVQFLLRPPPVESDTGNLLERDKRVYEKYLTGKMYIEDEVQMIRFLSFPSFFPSKIDKKWFQRRGNFFRVIFSKNKKYINIFANPKIVSF